MYDPKRLYETSEINYKVTIPLANSKSSIAISKRVRKPFHINHSSPSPKLAWLGRIGRKSPAWSIPLGRERLECVQCSNFWGATWGTAICPSWLWPLTGNRHTFNCWRPWRVKESSAALCSNRELAVPQTGWLRSAWLGQSTQLTASLLGWGWGERDSKNKQWHKSKLKKKNSNG